MKKLITIAVLASATGGIAGAAKICRKANSCAAGAWTVPSSFAVSDFTENNSSQTISFSMSGLDFLLETKCGGAAGPSDDSFGAPVGIAVGAGLASCKSCWVRLLSVNQDARCYGQWFAVKGAQGDVDGTKTCGYILKYYFSSFPYLINNLLSDYS